MRSLIPPEQIELTGDHLRALYKLATEAKDAPAAADCRTLVEWFNTSPRGPRPEGATRRVRDFMRRLQRVT